MNKKNKIIKLKYELAGYKTADNINTHLLEAKTKKCELLQSRNNMLEALIEMLKFQD